MGLESIQNRYLDGRAVMNCSDATGALIDEEVKEMLKVAYDKAKKIIEDHGGKIWATSKESIGTVMYFVLRKYQEVRYEQSIDH